MPWISPNGAFLHKVSREYNHAGRRLFSIYTHKLWINIEKYSVWDVNLYMPTPNDLPFALFTRAERPRVRERERERGRNEGQASWKRTWGGSESLHRILIVGSRSCRVVLSKCIRKQIKVGPNAWQLTKALTSTHGSTRQIVEAELLPQREEQKHCQQHKQTFLESM